MTTEKTFEINGLQPNSEHSIRVRALYRDGSYSEWSQIFKLKVKGDGTPPSQPAAPTIFVPDLSTELGRSNSAMGPQTVRFRHDSTKNGGGNLEGDIDYFEVYVNTTNSNTGGTQIGTVKATRPGSGAYSEANLSVNSPGESTSRWFYVIAVDMGGLRSEPSPTTQASSIPMIANAYISDLSADKITTGTLQASQKITVGDTVAIALKSNATSPRAEFLSYSGTEPAIGEGYDNNSVGFYMDSAGRFSLKKALTFDPDANDGAGQLTINAAGEFSGALSSEISLDAPNITGGSINIGPNIFQVNDEGRVIATNIETAQIYGGTISIGGTQESPNFYVDSDGNLITRGSATIDGPVMTGGSMTAGLFRTSELANINRIQIDGESAKDKLQFINSADGRFDIQISGYILEIQNNDTGSYGSGQPFNQNPELRIRSQVLINPNTDVIPQILYRTSNNTAETIARFRSNVVISGQSGPPYTVSNILVNGAYQQLSDLSIKDNIQISRSYLEDLNRIEIVNFTYIGSEEKQLGAVAQQVQEVFPSLVGDMGEGLLGIKYDVFVPMLITAVQELTNRVQYLEEQLETLNGN